MINSSNITSHVTSGRLKFGMDRKATAEALRQLADDFENHKVFLQEVKTTESATVEDFFMQTVVLRFAPTFMTSEDLKDVPQAAVVLGALNEGRIRTKLEFKLTTELLLAHSARLAQPLYSTIRKFLDGYCDGEDSKTDSNA